MSSHSISSLEVATRGSSTVAFYDNGLTRESPLFTVALSVVQASCKAITLTSVEDANGIKMGTRYIRIVALSKGYQVGFDSGSGNYCAYNVSSKALLGLISYLRSL